VRVSWTDRQGRFHHADARCLDASETGIRLEFAVRPDSDCYVNVRFEKHGVVINARVRHVIQRGLMFEAGLEFHGGWRWKSLAADSRAAG
jgi:hypothetical protein